MFESKQLIYRRQKTKHKEKETCWWVYASITHKVVQKTLCI